MPLLTELENLISDGSTEMSALTGFGIRQELESKPR
jgi:hypothetical protein